MPILAGSVHAPMEELRTYLEAISGAHFEIREAKAGAHGLYVGLASDFPWLRVTGTGGLGAEGYLIATTRKDVLLLAEHPLGVQHAVSAFLEALGCRWFFPGKEWEEIPRLAEIRGKWNQRGAPSFKLKRTLWYGHGAEPELLDQFRDWSRRNKLGGPQQISNGHTWYGLDPKTDFEQHPDWFALVGGRRQPTKPCYTHPEVLRQAIRYALEQAARGAPMVSLTPPDYLGFCECERCLALLKGGERLRQADALFARQPDGTLLSAASEAVFQFANRVTEEVARPYPKTLLGCLFYSSYAHPPSFRLHPNLFLQVTAGIRRTGLSIEDQLDALKKVVPQIGIYEYYSVYHWDCDYPDPGKLAPSRLVRDLRMFASKGVTSLTAEASNNWAARGLGYYLASKLLWDTEADAQAIARDFFERAFGPAAAPMERYYARWYRFGVELPRLEWKDEAASRDRAGSEVTDENLKACYRDLDEALALAGHIEKYRARLNRLRMYLHFLFLRRELARIGGSADAQAIADAIGAEMVFAARLTRTNMIHFRPLQGREFPRRFRKYAEVLREIPETRKDSWKQVGTPPEGEELDRLWAADKQALSTGR